MAEENKEDMSISADNGAEYDEEASSLCAEVSAYTPTGKGGAGVGSCKAVSKADLEKRVSFLETNMAKLVRNSRIQTLCLVALAVVVLGGVAYVLRNVLLPFVFSVFLTFVLNPVVRMFIHRLRMPRVVAILITMLICLSLLVAMAGFLSSSFLQLTNEVSNFSKNINSLVNKVLENPYLQQYGISREATIDAVGTKLADGAGQLATVLVSGVFGLCSNGVVVAIYLMFLLFGTNHNKDISDDSIWSKIQMSVESYIFLKTVLSGFMAALTWLILAALGVKMAAVIALMAFACNFVPNVGPIIASLVPVPVMLLSGQDGFVDICLAVALPGAIHFFVGHLLEPKLMGKSLDLDPVVILLGLMLAEVMWGPIGMLLAMPLMVVARILFDQAEYTRPLVDLMAGKLPDMQIHEEE